ncbi:hypothetical protein V6N11_078783 [Hibiscus sabdariffa]|uniref:AAA+ ATPase domain-containing protein n=1 Tax=Hibiscus sabdariffa TaxID=183260 RepID=A0ABR2RTY8_9ROSI
MDVLVSIVGSLASKAAEYTVDPPARQLGYLFNHKSKFQNLRSKVQDLKDAKERMQQSVEAANRNGEEIFDDVKRWLAEVNEKISEQSATQLQEDEEKATKRCFAGFCPDFNSRYRLSKKADKEADAVTQLLIKKDSFNTVSYLTAVEVTDIIKPVKVYEAFGSRTGAFDCVMAALEDDTVSIIGVYGMGGVGKTTLVKEAAKQAKEKQLFNEVVSVAINQTPNIVNIQKEIAEKLGLTTSNENIEVRAARLRERLKKEERVLVVLDDIWVSMDLRALGIPSVDEHKACKILMTSRMLDVLKSMDSHPNISIETLKEDEAWTLFKKMAGHIVERSDIQSTAVEVAKRCAGLPIAITTIAKALKPKENLFEWRDALRQLSKPSGRNFKGIPADAYSAIELSYKFLDAEELGPIFLLCSMMGHNANVEDLLRYAIGLSFIHDVNTIEESRDRVLTSVNNLKASCLLLEDSRPNSFGMHDVVRDVAQSIASRDLHWLALFKDMPDEEKMKESQLIRIQNANVSELLNHDLDCPNLNYFSIGLKGSLEISNNFFKGMERLKVLEFTETHFTSLPFSIGSLKTLRTLRLMHCGLKDIAILGELENLEILDLRRSRMEILPKEIGQLTKLKLLDLSHCYNLQVISPNVLSKLSRLEELYLFCSFDRWEAVGTENPSNASIVELQHLSHLTTLEVHIPHVKDLPKDNLFLGKMERYKISIGGDPWHWYNDRRLETSRMLKLKMNTSIHLIDAIKLLLRKTQSLYLEGLEDVGEILYDPYVESFGQLRSIKVKNCNMVKNLFSSSIARRLCQLEEFEIFNCENITTLIVENEEIGENDILEFNKLRILEYSQLKKFNGSWYSENTFSFATWIFDKKVSCPALEELKLYSVSGIEKIWHIDDQLPIQSFGGKCLTRLEVNNCHKLKHVFTSSMVKNFVQLRILTVSACDEMQEIIQGILGGEECVFPKLDSLKLENLSKLERFYCGINPIEFPSLRDLRISKCPTFTFHIRKSRVTLPHYLISEKVSCPALEVLTVRECHKLKYVFTSSMVKNFVQLKTLEVSKCDEMEGVIQGILAATEEGISGSTRVFPELDYLELDDLPKMKRFCCVINPIQFPSLRHLKIRQCHDLNAFSFDAEKSRVELPHYLFNEKVSCPALEELHLDSVGGIEIIWHMDDQFPLMSFGVPSLTHLEVKRCQKLKYAFTSSMVRCFVHLKAFEVSNCDEMEGVMEGILVATEEERISGSIRMFPKLHSMELKWLPKLNRFCCGINPIEFPSLRYLILRDCPDLNTFCVGNGKSKVVQPHCLFNEKMIFPVLEELEILKVNNLEMLWLDLLVEYSFSRLTSISLEDCPKLLNVFPWSMLTRLQRLNRIRIWNCESVEEIIFESRPKEGGSRSATSSLSPLFVRPDVITFEFPSLTSLNLEDLPKLKSIYHKMHTISWPSLKEMVVKRCHKVETMFASHETCSQQPLFWVNESTFPNLHQLTLGWNAGIKEIIWHGKEQQQQQIVSHYLCNLKVVILEPYPGQVSIFPSYLFRLLSLPSLQTLDISCSSFKELMFQSEKSGEEKPALLLHSKITELRLDLLPELMHLWTEKEGFPNLRTLHMRFCPKLKFHLVPSSVSFRNLVTLKIEFCHGIISLITHSTAKTLVQLKEMSIRSCNKIEEIIQAEDDDDDDDGEIIFPQLNSLELVCLPKLQSFCSSEKYTFGFPSLQILDVAICPKMKRFSQGDSNTPMLHKAEL